MSKYKILLLSDHQLSTSGVAVQSRYLINCLIATGRYSFRCLGGALKHVSLETAVVNPDFIVKPVNGFGDKNLWRQALVIEKPDAMMLFTDPRMFLDVFSIEDEIHQVCPLVYWHLWDNYPTPTFNDVLYESCDLINCINWPTYDMIKPRFPDRVNYVPHAVPPDLFQPLPDKVSQQGRKQLLGHRADWFVGLFVSRNARRKAPSDILAGFKMFLDELEKREGHRKAVMLMHTDPLDPEGPNLHHVIEMLCLSDNVVFSRDKIEFPQMNLLYNCCDVLLSVSLAEGFGLSVLEAKMAGKPVIGHCTGGVTRQVRDHETGAEYGVAIEPAAKCLVGNQIVPYIYEDVPKHEDIKDAFMKTYLMGPDGRRELGLRAREHALKDYDINKMVKDWDETLSSTIEKWRKGELPANKRWSVNEL